MTDIANMAGVLAALRRMSIATLFTTAMISIGYGQIALAPLSEHEIKSRLFGQRVIGEYADGKSWAENFNADGSSQYVQDGTLTLGQMHFEGKRLCFTYDPQDMTGGCFEIWPRGKNCFDFYAGPNGGLPAKLNDKRFGRGWDARAWIDGEPATCETEHVS